MITKFRTEILRDPFYRIRERYTFKTYDELASFYNAVLSYHEEKSKFGIEV
ncbi:MAG: hypothetical protein ACE5Z5_12665 [Candidatus Bathyarchaeia archaeon]